MLDAAAEPQLLALLMDKIYTGDVLDAGDRKLEFRPTERFRQGAAPAVDRVRAIDAEQSNTTAIIDSDYVVKIFRRLHAGVNPEIEVGRFLTDRAGYTGAPPLLGAGQSFKAGAGLFGATDGISLWVFIVNTDLANSILYSKFDGTAWTAWAAVQGTDVGIQSRNYISGSPKVGNNQVGPTISSRGKAR